VDRRQRIISVLNSVSGKGGVPATDESLFDSGYLDSFALADMVSALEKEFGIKIPDSDLNPRKFESIDRIDQYLETRA
jgi:acyl carrier protein